MTTIPPLPCAAATPLLGYTAARASRAINAAVFLRSCSCRVAGSPVLINDPGAATLVHRTGYVARGNLPFRPAQASRWALRKTRFMNPNTHAAYCLAQASNGQGTAWPTGDGANGHRG